MTDATQATPDSGPGTPEIPDHELLRCIGSGSFGQVWLARNYATGQYRAVKVVYRRAFRDSHPFEREFSGVLKYEPISRSDPGLVNILHVGQSKGAGYFYSIMELADDQQGGQPINPEGYAPRTLYGELRKRGRLPLKECLEIGLSLTTALDYLHRHSLVHRDIKPSNIIFVNGAPKLADIGLVTDLDSTLTFVGTEGYIAPEGPRGPRADVYSLGKVLYEISTGKDRLEFPDLPSDLLDLPDREQFLQFNRVFIKACKADPAERYQNARDLGDDLARLQKGLPPKRATAIRASAAGIVVVVALLVGIAVYVVHSPSVKTPPIPPVTDTKPDKVSISTPLVLENFTAAKLNPSVWTWGEKGEESREGTGQRTHRVEQRDGRLLIEAKAEHQGGWTCHELVWVDTVVDLRGKGDIVLDAELGAEARNGGLKVMLSDGSEPLIENDPHMVELWQARGENYYPLSSQSNTVHVEISGSSNLAIISTKEGFKIADISRLASWKLRLFVYAGTSAGFRSGEAQLRADLVRISRIPEKTGVIGFVTDELTGRPIDGVNILTADGTKLVTANVNGSFTLELPSGSGQLVGEREGFFRSDPLTVEVEPGKRTVAGLTMKREVFGFGDVVSSVPCSSTDFAIEAGSGSLYFASITEGIHSRVFRKPMAGGKAEVVADVNDLRGLVLCGDKLFATAAWPGLVYQLSDGRFELFKSLRGDGVPFTINWPEDAAYDGRYLWFVENSDIDNRFGLYALDLNTRRIVAQIHASQDRQVCGLAWDGQRFWVSSRSGRVYEVDPHMALSEGSIEAGTHREFKGFYDRLAYADGYLWGLDTEMKRACKILINSK